MTPRIETIHEKKLIGICLTMSFADFKVGELWRNFLPKRKAITNHITNDLYSVVVYSPGHFEDFNPTSEFVKWAAVEVPNFDHIPNDMETLILPGGLNAVFHYRGLSTDNAIYQFIYGTWLPASEYALDNRPHFEVLGNKYKNNDPESEEEIWIPVKLKLFE
jgi:AraC family transcriptional regulator